jgi:5-methyltetrahydrofolate--homocysteine methyltransferase
MDQDPLIFEQLQKKDVSRLIDIAREGHSAGLDMVDILIFHQDLDEVELLPRIAYAVKKEVGCPIALDTRNVQALEAALREIYPDKALINSVSAERKVLDELLPIVEVWRSYGRDAHWRYLRTSQGGG